MCIDEVGLAFSAVASYFPNYERIREKKEIPVTENQRFLTLSSMSHQLPIPLIKSAWVVVKL